MSNLLTVQMLVKNNEETIEYTLDSLQPLVDLGAKIIAGDLGCTDQTIRKCMAYDVEIIGVSLNESLSQARNYLLDKINSQWVFFIEPYETILTGTECFLAAMNNRAAYKVSLLQGDMATKEIRFWHRDAKLRFRNPVFETLAGQAEDTGIYLARAAHQTGLQMELAQKWLEKQPLSLEPIYYLACAHLANKNWQTFLNYANMYLHQEKTNSMSATMTRYYCSMVKCYIEKNYQEAIQFLLPCLAVRPTMAEYWCLLGDVYYAVDQLRKAECFYENAILLGSRRLRNDDWPLEISKYKVYPEKMIEACKTIRQSSKVYKNILPDAVDS